MVLSNAERQARYRKRLREKASPEGLPVLAQEAADRALDALWSYHNRPTADGRKYGDFDGVESRDSLPSYIANTDGLISWCRVMVTHAEEDDHLLPDERAAFEAVALAGDALDLAALRAGKRKRR